MLSTKDKQLALINWLSGLEEGNHMIDKVFELMTQYTHVSDEDAAIILERAEKLDRGELETISWDDLRKQIKEKHGI